MKTGSSSGDHAAAALSLMYLQHDLRYCIYTRISSHVAMVYVSTLVLIIMS